MVEKIKERAYFLWEEAGKPEGCDLEFWLKAEEELTTLDRRTFLKRALDFVQERSWLVPFA